MKVGIEICHGFIDDLEYNDFSTAFDRVKAFGFDGMYYKSPQYLSEELDLGKLKDARRYADDLGLYLEFGLGRVNPFNTGDNPKVWLLGGGDYRLALERIISAAAEIGCHELIGVTAGWRYAHSGYFQLDRFRTDAPWKDQLLATEKFLTILAPILRHYGSRVNIETHEEITSYEALRMVEVVGDDVVGVAFDTANVLSTAEDPVAVAKRVAPFCHQTHVKDAILFYSETGLVRQVKPCGQGIVDWPQILTILYQQQPGLRLNIEDHKGFQVIDLYREEWRQLHPDLNLAEMGEIVRLAQVCDRRLRQGEIEDIQQYEAIPFEDQLIDRLGSSLKYLNKVIDTYGLR